MDLGPPRVGTHWPGAQATQRGRTRKLSVGWGSPDQSEVLILSPHIHIHKVHRNAQQGSYTGRHSIQETTHRFSHILPNTHTYTHRPCLHHMLVEGGHLRADRGARQGLPLARAELRDFSFCSFPSPQLRGGQRSFWLPLPNPGFNLCGGMVMLHLAVSLPFYPLTTVLPQFLLDEPPFPAPFLQVSAQKAS